MTMTTTRRKSIDVERADVGRQILPGVTLVDVEAHEETSKRGRFATPATPVATLTYRIADATVTMRSGDLRTKPAPVNVEIDAPDGGVTYELLHLVPFQDARRRFKIMGRSLMAGTMASFAPSRLQTPEQWARFARAYVDLHEAGDASPVTSLARAMDLSRNTVSARIRYARDKGLLTRPADGPVALTEQARKILTEIEER